MLISSFKQEIGSVKTPLFKFYSNCSRSALKFTFFSVFSSKSFQQFLPDSGWWTEIEICSFQKSSFFENTEVGRNDIADFKKFMHLWTKCWKGLKGSWYVASN